MESARAANLGLVASRLARQGYTDTPGNRPRIILFGDSITEQSFGEGGFGASLADKYRRSADVILRGYSGYNSAHAVALLDAVFPLDDPSPPVLVTVCFGANDAVNENSSAMELQGCSIDNFEMNLKTIAGHLSKMTPPPAVLFITPPPINPEAWHATCLTNEYHSDPQPDRSLQRTGYYATTMKNAAAEMGMPCVDLFAALMGVPAGAYTRPLLSST